MRLISENTDLKKKLMSKEGLKKQEPTIDKL